MMSLAFHALPVLFGLSCLWYAMVSHAQHIRDERYRDKRFERAWERSYKERAAIESTMASNARALKTMAKQLDHVTRQRDALARRLAFRQSKENP